MAAEKKTASKSSKIEESLQRYLGKYVEVYANGYDGYMSGVLEEIVDGWILVVVGGSNEFMCNIANISLIRIVERQ